MTEAELQAVIIDALRIPQAGAAWMLHHDTDARRSHSGGWPDLFALHPPTRRTLVLELKSASGRMREGQVAWLMGLRLALRDDGPLYRTVIGVCRPANLDMVLRWVAARELNWRPDLPLS